MFVDRQRGQVGMTLGTFPDGKVTSHTFLVREEVEGISVTDKVQIQYEQEIQDSSCHCGLLEQLEHMFSSGSDNYLDQTIASMSQMRRLLQEGGEIGTFMLAPGIDESTEQQNERTPTTPLLG